MGSSHRGSTRRRTRLPIAHRLATPGRSACVAGEIARALAGPCLTLQSAGARACCRQYAPIFQAPELGRALGVVHFPFGPPPGPEGVGPA